MRAFKNEKNGEIVIPTAGGEYEERLEASNEWNELTHEELQTHAKKTRLSAASEAQADHEATRAITDVTSGASSEGDDEGAPKPKPQPSSKKSN